MMRFDDRLPRGWRDPDEDAAVAQEGATATGELQLARHLEIGLSPNELHASCVPAQRSSMPHEVGMEAAKPTPVLAGSLSVTNSLGLHAGGEHSKEAAVPDADADTAAARVVGHLPASSASSALIILAAGGVGGWLSCVAALACMLRVTSARRKRELAARWLELAHVHPEQPPLSDESSGLELGSSGYEFK